MALQGLPVGVNLLFGLTRLVEMGLSLKSYSALPGVRRPAGR